MITLDQIKQNCDLRKVKTILEVGTGRGDLAEAILRNQRAEGVAECKYYGFDLWEDFGPEIPGGYEVPEHEKVYVTDVNTKLKNINTNVQLLKGRSVDTLAGFANTNTETLDLVIINGSPLHQDIHKDFFLTNPFYRNGTVVFFDYADKDAKQIVDELEFYNPKMLNETVACITWKEEGEGPIEFISEPGPV